MSPARTEVSKEELSTWLQVQQKHNRLKKKLRSLFTSYTSLPTLNEFLEQSEELQQSFYCKSSFVILLTPLVTSGGILFDMWIAGHKDLNVIQHWDLAKKQKLLEKEGPGFFWDFCVWSYRTSQKQGSLMFYLTLVLRFYGLTLQGIFNMPFLLKYLGLSQLHDFRISLTTKTFLIKYSALDKEYSEEVNSIIQSEPTGKFVVLAHLIGISFLVG